MQGRRLTVATLASCLAVGAEVAVGQQDATSPVPTVVIPTEPTCSSCRVRLEHVVSLGDPGDSSSVVPWSTVARNSRGEFYVAPMAHPGEIYVYGPDGRYRRKIGRAGRGPGEYGAGLMVAVDGRDSIHVIDNDNRRWTVLGPDHEFARSTPLPGYVRKYFLAGDGRLVTHAAVGTPQCFGLPLQVLAPNGSVERCFGGDGGVIRRDRPHSRMRQVADAGEGLIWSARVNRYEIELLDTLGHVQRLIVRDADWFEPWERDAPGAFVTEPPRPRVMGVAARGDLVLVFALVANKHWSPPPPGSSRALTAASLDRHHDSILELLDPMDGTLKASLSFRTQLLPTGNGTLAYSVAQTDTGDTRMDLWRVEIDAESRDHPR